MGEGVLKLVRLWPNTPNPQPLTAKGGERLGIWGGKMIGVLF
jgi:hypothetical protein